MTRIIRICALAAILTIALPVKESLASHEDCTHGGAGTDIIGTSGNDVCNGTSSGEEMFAKEGSDTFTGFDGWDDIHGQKGKDSLYESNGHGAVSGGLYHDRIHGNAGDDNVKDNVSNTNGDEDHACDGTGNDDIDIDDGDGLDTWFNYPDGQAEIQVQYDKDLGDNIADNRTDCPLPSRW